jgi:CBS domain-containing protein
MTMTVSQILKDKGRDVATAPQDTPLKDIIQQLALKKIGALVIVDEAGAICGIISERDIIRVLAEKGAASLGEPVSEHMTKPVYTCSEHHSTSDILERMTRHRFRHMPVVENGQLCGIVSIGDIVKQRISEAELEALSMRAYIATG